MSQFLCFYKVNILSEEVKNFPRENIYESVKLLFRGSDTTTQNIEDMIQEHFTEIKLSILDITYENIQGINQNFEEQQKFIFDKTKSSFFFVTESDWEIIQIIIDKNIGSYFNKDREYSWQERLANITKICIDCDNLKQVFNNKQLFALIVS
ncbi:MULTISPECIES: hypothetical protein [Aphanizomenon]|jgi:hypothetical protein|uniref:hypothetical protein n=1 Tax=Aphanizomenon TaxID=1175 RepID=UPI0005440041|nr:MULTISPECIES: hypothetical protein [Aphanizomenon]KHG39421.1 hypothetical protein OA07_23795 [Aphanizomenon flos-aquae 2012/KM1/D3]MTJ32015.1 hypothetical protein [Aphanizomenon sp. UHCC 0183]QSV69916.1 MAG: hypothetical protein HEQ20_03080 [Aphanizomenon flos-aquae KM1D3_PB]